MSQADRKCFVLVNGNNVFQDKTVCTVVTFVYVYFINMKKEKTTYNFFIYKEPLKFSNPRNFIFGKQLNLAIVNNVTRETRYFCTKKKVEKSW